METQKERTVAMNVRGIPESVYRKFRITCIAEGATIQSKILELIKAASAGTVVTQKARTAYGPDGQATEVPDAEGAE